MNDVPPGQGDSDDADELYRRASAQDAGGPSEAVRRAILQHSAQLAAERAAKNNVARRAIKRPMRQAWWRPAAFGTLAAAALAGLIVVPQFIRPPTPSTSASSPAPQNLTRSEGVAADQAADAAMKSAARSAPAARQSQYTAPSAPAAPNAPAAPSASVARNVAPAPSAGAAASGGAAAARSTDIEETVVTGQRRREADEQPANSVAGRPAALNGLQAQAADDAQDKRRAAGAAPSPRSEALADPAAQLRHAAEIGDLVALQALLDQQPAVDARDANGRTALMWATLRGRAQAVDRLLSAGADPNAADARGTTPLQAALAGDQSAIAEALRRAGAR
jgi:hypothetical protein